MIPEPFSITLSVFATIGFLNLARQGAQALHKDVKAYSTAPAEMLSILKDTEYAEYRINLWKRIWSIQKDTHADYPLYLWGNGWKHIQHQIGKIEDVSCKIDKILSPFLRKYEARKFSQNFPVTSNNKTTVGAAAEQRLLQQDADAKYIDSEISWGKKIEFVLSKSSQLKELLDQLPARFDALDHICKEAYFQRHKLSKNIPNHERRDVATFEMLVAQAWKSRQASYALYDRCRSAGEGDIELELSLLKKNVKVKTPRSFNAGIPERLCYYLTIPSTTLSSMVRNMTANSGATPSTRRSPRPSQLEILAEENPKSRGQIRETLRDACIELCRNQLCYLSSTAADTSTATSPTTFKLWKSTDKVENSGRTESKLRELLANAATKADDEDLSLRERIEVAYRIAECTLLLLETSWLSDLDSVNITRAYAVGKEPRYRLLIGSSRSEINGPERVQKILLGRVLRELALGRSIGPYDRDTEPALLSTELGRRYQRAIDFCYRPDSSHGQSIPGRDQRTAFSKTALIEFFSEVFLPLAELHQANVPFTSQDDFLGDDTEPSLRFLPGTYGEAPSFSFGGLIPALTTSKNSPATLLDTVRASVKAMSIRSVSTIGQFRKTDAIVYYVATQKFVKLDEGDIPEDAHRLEIPSHGMTYDICLPTRSSGEKRLVATLLFEELGFRVTWRRLLGKINEIYVVDHFLDGPAT